MKKMIAAGLLGVGVLLVQALAWGAGSPVGQAAVAVQAPPVRGQGSAAGFYHVQLLDMAGGTPSVLADAVLHPTPTQPAAVYLGLPTSFASGFVAHGGRAHVVLGQAVLGVKVTLSVAGDGGLSASVAEVRMVSPGGAEGSTQSTDGADLPLPQTTTADGTLDFVGSDQASLRVGAHEVLTVIRQP